MGGSTVGWRKGKGGKQRWRAREVGIVGTRNWRDSDFIGANGNYLEYEECSKKKKNFNIFNRSQLSSNFCDFIFSSSLRCIITNTLYVSSMQSHRYKTNKLNWKSYEYRDTILPQDLRSLVNVIPLFFSPPNTDYFISKTPSK